MAAALTEGALDLSAKPFEIKPSCPSLTNGSEMNIRCERPPSAVSSDPEESVASHRKRPLPVAGAGFSGAHGIPPAKSPRASPEPSAGSVGSTPRSSPLACSPPGTSADCSSPTGSQPTQSAGLSPTSARPFKMYPLEPLPSMYSQFAAAASQGIYPYGPASPSPAMGVGMGLFDNAISLSSPIGQYLQQKKRRMESREGATYKSNLPNAAGTQLSPGGSSSGGEDSNQGSISACTSSTQNGSMFSFGDKKMKPVPEDRKDEAYWERRRKNNEAAKRSRDARRAKEEEIALRAAFLEQENLKLRAQVAILKNETAKLHYMLYNRM